MAQRQRQAERKAQYRAERAHDERAPVPRAAARVPAPQSSQAIDSKPGTGRAARGDESRRQLRCTRVADRQARHRQRHREDQHTQPAQRKAAALALLACLDRQGLRHSIASQAAVATSTAASTRLNTSRRLPCASQWRKAEPTSA
jgi:hypothetical protein